MVKKFEPIEGRNAEIIETVMTCPEVAGLPDDVQFKIRLCVEEVEENILLHSGSTWIELTVELDGDTLHISFRDNGIEFNPLAHEDPDTTVPLEEREVGGLGIFLCKNMMDSLEYRYSHGCNEFTMGLLCADRCGSAGSIMEIK